MHDFVKNVVRLVPRALSKGSKPWIIVLCSTLYALCSLLLPAPSAWAELGAHPQRVLVRFKAAPADSPAGRRLLTRTGAAVARRFQIVPNLELLALPAGKPLEMVLGLLRESPLVLYAEPDYLVSANLIPNDPLFGGLWGLANTGQDGGLAGADINAPAAWNISTGSADVVVVVIDTGVDYTHPDLIANIWNNPGEIPENSLDDDGNGYVDDLHGINTVGLGGEVSAPGGYRVNDPVDDNGHGTHVAGTIGAAGNNSLGIVGVNWTVRIAACKFLDDAGNGYISDAIACLQYARDLKSLGIPILATSNSWSGPGYSRSLEEAIKNHLADDILFVAAAGNSGANSDESPEYPGAFDLPNLIAVSATDNHDLLANFSNFGPRSIHVGAPGVDILSTCTSGLPECTGSTFSNPYDTFSGTSMAAPHVTGLAALLKAQDPGRAGKTIRNLILAGGDSIAALSGKTLTGRRIDAAGSMLCSGNRAFGIRAPVLEPLYAVINSPLKLTALNLNCGIPAGAVQVQIGVDTVPLLDNGINPDLQSVDGNYSGTWTPTTAGDYTLNFWNGLETKPAAVRAGPLLTYNSAVTTYAWVTIAGTNLNLSDESMVILTPQTSPPLPFPLRFYGLEYEKIYISDNGALSFSRGPIYPDNYPLPGTYQASLVAPFWDDLVPSGTDNVYYGVTGSAPHQRFVIEWRNLDHYPLPLSLSGVNFQVIFFEDSDSIVFQYKDTFFANIFYDRGASASVGLQLNPDWGVSYSYNQPVIHDTPPLAIVWTPAALPPTPRLKVEDDYVIFPDTRVGQDKHQWLYLHNIGNANLSVTALPVSPAQFSLISPPALPLILAPGSQQALDLIFHPDDATLLSGTLSVQSNSYGGNVDVPLQGRGVFSPDLTVTPAPALDFGPVIIGNTASVTLTLGNQGNSSLGISSFAVLGGSPTFAWTGPSLPLTIPAGSSQNFTIKFHPSNPTPYSATLVIYTNDPQKSTVRLALTGSGIPQPEIQLFPVFLEFKRVTPGSSANLSFAILNSGVSLLTINSLSLTGSGFSLNSPPSVPFQVNPGNRQDIWVEFSPPVTASYYGQVQVHSNAPASPTTTVSLVGIGAAPAPPQPPTPGPVFFVSPSSLDFGTVTVDSSTELTFVLENRGTEDLQILSCTSSGTGFSLLDPPSFPLSLASLANQQIRVRFYPVSPGGFSGSVTINSSDPQIPLRIIPLSGIGKAPPPPPEPQIDFSPSEINFSNVIEGTALDLALSLGNLGDADLVIDDISVTGDGFSFPQPLTLPLVVAPGDNRDISIRFLPSAAGDFTGSVSVSSNDPAFPLAEIPVRGTGLTAPPGPPHLAVSARRMDFTEVSIGEFREMPLAVTNTAEGNLVISGLMADGDFALPSPPGLPLTLAAGETLNLVVRFSPGWIGARTGNLRIASNDPDEPELVVSLSGTGTVAEEKTSGCSCSTPGTRSGAGPMELIFLLALAVFRLRRKMNK